MLHHPSCTMGRTQRGQKNFLPRTSRGLQQVLRNLPPPSHCTQDQILYTTLVTAWSVKLKKGVWINFNSLKSKPLNWAGLHYTTGRKLWHIYARLNYASKRTVCVEAYGLDDFSLNHVHCSSFFIFVFYLLQVDSKQNRFLPRFHVYEIIKETCWSISVDMVEYERKQFRNSTRFLDLVMIYLFPK